MGIFNISKFHPRAEFVLLPAGGIPLQLFRAELRKKVWSVPIVNVELVDEGLVLTWAALPSANDDFQLNQLVAAFVGGETTSRVLAMESPGQTLAPTSANVDKINVQTGKLDGGDYLFVWVSSIWMASTAANTGVRGTMSAQLTGGPVRSQPDHWGESLPHAFNGSMAFEVETGQQLTVLMQVAKVGAGAPNAVMAGVRVSLTKTLSN